MAMRKNSSWDPRTAAHIPAFRQSYLITSDTFFITRGFITRYFKWLVPRGAVPYPALLWSNVRALVRGDSWGCVNPIRNVHQSQNWKHGDRKTPDHAFRRSNH